MLDALEAEPGRRWTEADVAALGLDPSTVRRAFKRHYGMSFLELALQMRLRKGTRALAEGYLNYLYSEEGQRIAAKNFYRPRNEAVAAEFKDQFPALKLVTIDGDFGGWKAAQPKFFNDGGVFDQIYQAQ